MPRPRWITKTRSAASGAGLLILCCGGYVVAQVSARLLLRYFELPTLGLVAAAVTIGIVVHKRHDRDAARRIETWVAAGDWDPVGTDLYWPWVPLLRKLATVHVRRAWAARVDDLPVIVGELDWDENALDGAVVGWKGYGVFVVIRLPVPTEPMAIRRPHRTLGDSHRLDRPELHDAYEDGRIPPWTANDQDLFTFEAVKGRLTPEALDDLVRRTLLIVHLLDLGPDGPGSIDPAADPELTAQNPE